MVSFYLIFAIKRQSDGPAEHVGPCWQVGLRVMSKCIMGFPTGPAMVVVAFSRNSSNLTFKEKPTCDLPEENIDKIAFLIL